MLVMHAMPVANREPSILVPGVLGAATVFALVGNPIVVFACALTFIAIWHGSLSSAPRAILATYLSFQWLQVSVKLILANGYGVDLGEPQLLNLGLGSCEECAFEVNDRTIDAVLLACAALTSTALGIRAFSRSEPFDPETRAFSAQKLLLAYLALLIVDRMVAPFASGGLSQPALVIGTMKYAPIVLLIYVWIVEKRGALPLALAVFTEVGLGFTGFFGGYATVFFVGIVALLTLVRSQPRRVTSVLVVAVPTFLLLGSFWTVIKPAYRSILNQGTETQAVMIGMDERAKALGELGRNVGSSDLLDGVMKMALRLSYVDYLSNVLQYVPSNRPHEGGTLWAESIYHVLTPRFMFPNKPPLPSDSERTNLYTGQSVASGDKGTSISIGYVGESYIDFGFAGTLVVSFVLGAVYALLARHILRIAGQTDLAIGVAVLIVVLMPTKAFESSNIKMFPGLLWNWIVGMIFVAVIWRAMKPYLLRQSLAVVGTGSASGERVRTGGAVRRLSRPR